MDSTLWSQSPSGKTFWQCRVASLYDPRKCDMECSESAPLLPLHSRFHCTDTPVTIPALLLLTCNTLLLPDWTGRCRNLYTHGWLSVLAMAGR